MISSMRQIRQHLAPVLAGVVLATSAAVPLLDRMPDSPLPALETEHHPATCAVGHDHRICTLVGASLWLASASDAPALDGGRLDSLPVHAPDRVRSTRFRGTHRSRAPPIV